MYEESNNETSTKQNNKSDAIIIIVFQYTPLGLKRFKVLTYGLRHK